MVRGVNRNIIEVNCTENKYFDKVLLFVDPNCGLSPEKLQRKADSYVKIIINSGVIPGTGPTEVKSGRSKLCLTLGIAASLIVAAAIIGLIIL